MLQAMALHQQGQLVEAERLYAAITEQDPHNAQAWHLLGIIALQTGRLEHAAELIGAAIARDTNVADAYCNRAIALRRLGRLEEALDSLDKAIALEPGNAEAHNNRGTVLRDTGRHHEALTAFDHAIALRRDYVEAHMNRGHLLRAAAQPEAALQSYDHALALQPNNAPLHHGRGNALLDLSRGAEALASYDRAIALRPDHAGVHVSRGQVLMNQARPADALASYDAAIALRPDHAEAYVGRGNALRYLQRAEEALASYDRAVALKPDDASAWFSRGELLRSEGRTDDAVVSLQTAVAKDPLHGAARIGACTAELPILYRTADEIPLRRRRYLAALTQLEAAIEDPAVRRSVAAAIQPPPFYLPYQGENDVAPHARYGRMACRLLADEYKPVCLARRPAAGERIRLGIVSAYFHAHTIWKLFVEGWLRELDRNRFAVLGFHTGDRTDEKTAIAAAQSDLFIQNLPSRDAWRQAIIDSAPHALLFPEIGMNQLTGWLAAQRFAPVQCVSWGHPVTTGMPTVDYFLSSELMEPPDGDSHYAEQLVRLPNLATHVTADVAPPPVLDHADFGLDATRPVFWSGQTQYKYLPQYDWIYPRIAGAVGPCQFVFVSSVSATLTQLFRDRLGQAFAAAGLDADRYCHVFPHMPHDRFMGLAGLADVILDTPGWSGGRSTLDCLAYDPAIVTWPGLFMRGRHTAAILRRIGCEATIAGSLDAYVDIAVRLARDPAWRAELRRAVAERKHLAFRDTDYVRGLEQFVAGAVAAG
jgi:protein O-GlcNAc transferase